MNLTEAYRAEIVLITPGIFKYVVFQRHPKALLSSKGLKFH